MSAFSDKRDKEYYRMEIKDHLFDIFKHKAKKCKLRIPPTVSIFNGKINTWFFNSIKEPGNPILIRNSDKLTSFEILKYFANLKNIDSRSSIEQVIEKYNYDPYFYKACAFVRFNNGEKLIVTGKDLAIVLSERINNIQSVQGIVDTQWRQGSSSNVLVCEYRMDKEGMPPSFNYMIKSTLTGHQELFRENPDLFSSKNTNRANMEYIYKSHLEDIEGADGKAFFKDLYGNERDIQVKFRTESMRSYINKDHKTSYCKSMDTKMNTETGKITKELAVYIESAHKFKVKKLVCTFICDQMQNIYLLGIKELLFDFFYTGIYHVESVKSSYSKHAEIEFDDLISTIQANENEKRQKGSLVQIEQNKKVSEIKHEILGIQTMKERMKNLEQENPSARNYTAEKKEKSNALIDGIQTFHIPAEKRHKKTFSNILLSKIQVNQCQGDFCEFYTITNSQLFVEDLREVQIDSELKKQREDPNTYQDLVRKPFQILNTLRIKCRENLEETILIMKQHQIVPKIDNILIYSDDKDIDAQIMNLMKTKTQRRDVENIDNLYKPVRVCKLCYTVYCIMSKHFDKIGGFSEKGSFGEFPKSLSKSQLSHRPGLSTQRVLRDSALNNMSNNGLPRINSQAGIDDFDIVDGITDRKGKHSSLTSLNSARRQTTIDKGNPKTKVSPVEGQSEAGNIHSPREKEMILTKRKSEAKIKEIKGGKIILKKSHSQLTNTRLLHGILQKVSSPEVVETERKIMVERELMKQRVKREGIYVHNLLDLVDYKDDKTLKEDTSKLASDEQEKRIKKASLAYKDTLKEMEKEDNDLRQSLLKEDNPLLISDNQKKQTMVNSSELRRRIAEKVTKYKLRPNAKLAPYSLDSMYNKSTARIKTSYDYKLSTSRMQTLYRKLVSFETKSIPLYKFCDVKCIEMPPMEIASKVEVLILNSKTAIPFLVLSSEEDNSTIQSGHNILVIVHDMFHSFFESIQFYEKILSSFTNTKVVLYNYPGQAFTSYDLESIQTNEELATVLDSFLNFLSEKKRISEEDKLHLMGIGYGGNIASCFLSNNSNINMNIQSFLVINSFLKIDREIETTAQEWIKVLKGLPVDIPEIHFNHYYVMALNQEGAQLLKEENFLKDKIEKNPIKIDGKIHILKGLIESLNLSDNFKRLELNVYVVHSLNNCIFRSNHAELFMQTATKQELSPKRKLKQEKKGERKVFFYEGGHDIATENPDVLKKMAIDFLTSNSSAQYKAFSLLKSPDYL